MKLTKHIFYFHFQFFLNFCSFLDNSWELNWLDCFKNDQTLRFFLGLFSSGEDPDDEEDDEDEEELDDDELPSSPLFLIPWFLVTLFWAVGMTVSFTYTFGTIFYFSSGMY